MPTDPNTLIAMKQALLQSMNGGIMGNNFAQLTPEQQQQVLAAIHPQHANQFFNANHQQDEIDDSEDEEDGEKKGNFADETDDCEGEEDSSDDE